jgi:enolase
MADKLKIKSIQAYEVLDSRGFPTVCCIVESEEGIKGKAMVPSGASTGEKEALELRDGDKKRYGGKGVLKAVDNVNKIIAPALIIEKDIKIDQQSKIDEFMMKLDGTEFKTKLGANSILAVSLACAKCAAKIHKKPLYQYIRENILNKHGDLTYIMPVPMLNVINGGAHADNTIDFQEFMFMPIGAKSVRQACQIASECFHTLQKILKSKNFNTNKGDEGGFAPALKSAEEALDLMIEAIKNAGYKPGVEVSIALDTACSEIYDQEKKVYRFKKAIAAGILDETNGTKTTDQMVQYIVSLTKKYPIISIEDGLAETE